MTLGEDEDPVCNVVLLCGGVVWCGVVWCGGVVCMYVCNVMVWCGVCQSLAQPAGRSKNFTLKQKVSFLPPSQFCDWRLLTL